MMPNIRMLLERQNIINIPTAIQNRINPISRFKVASRRCVVIIKICKKGKGIPFDERIPYTFSIKSAIIVNR